MRFNFNLQIPEYRPVDLKSSEVKDVVKMRGVQGFYGLPNMPGQSKPVGGATPYFLLDTCLHISDNGVYLGALSSKQLTHSMFTYGMTNLFPPERVSRAARSLFNRRKYVVDAQGCPWETRVGKAFAENKQIDDYYFAEKTYRFDLSIMRKLKVPIVLITCMTDLARTMHIEDGQVMGTGTTTRTANLLVHKSAHQAALCCIRSKGFEQTEDLYPVITYYDNPLDLACYKFVQANLRSLFFEMPIYIHVVDGDLYTNPKKIAKYSGLRYLDKLYREYMPIMQLVNTHNSFLIN